MIRMCGSPSRVASVCATAERCCVMRSSARRSENVPTLSSHPESAAPSAPLTPAPPLVVIYLFTYPINKLLSLLAFLSPWLTLLDGEPPLISVSTWGCNHCNAPQKKISLNDLEWVNNDSGAPWSKVGPLHARFGWRPDKQHDQDPLVPNDSLFLRERDESCHVSSGSLLNQ